jgi:hypothetical protein
MVDFILLVEDWATPYISNQGHQMSEIIQIQPEDYAHDPER